LSLEYFRQCAKNQENPCSMKGLEPNESRHDGEVEWKYCKGRLKPQFLVYLSPWGLPIIRTPDWNGRHL
jgi:hypothetical protein